MTPADLIAWRRLRGLSQAACGAQLTPKVSRETINAWERGRTPLPSHLWFALQAAAMFLDPQLRITPRTHPWLYERVRHRPGGGNYVITYTRRPEHPGHGATVADYVAQQRTIGE